MKYTAAKIPQIISCNYYNYHKENRKEFSSKIFKKQKIGCTKSILSQFECLLFVGYRFIN